MKDKEWVLKYIQRKSELIYELTGLDYVDPADIEEANSWSDEQCSCVREQIEGVGLRWLNDTASCPWCLLFDECSMCEYGKRHGECGTDDARYDTIWESATYNSNKTTSHLTQCLMPELGEWIEENKGE